MDDSIARNRARWEADAARWVEPGRRNWAADEPTWGIWKIPESELRLLDDVAGARVGMYRFEWPGSEEVEFHLSHGDMIRLLRENGFEVLDLLELQPAPGAETRFPYVTTEWARRWPSEEVWRARRR